jgi:hypothetical protein
LCDFGLDEEDEATALGWADMMIAGPELRLSDELRARGLVPCAILVKLLCYLTCVLGDIGWSEGV